MRGHTNVSFLASVKDQEVPSVDIDRLWALLVCATRVTVRVDWTFIRSFHTHTHIIYICIYDR